MIKLIEIKIENNHMSAESPVITTLYFQIIQQKNWFRRLLAFKRHFFHLLSRYNRS